MKGNDIRSRFLEYFQEKGHALVESSSLVPKDDPTLLFTNAGMVQFKRVFMGEEKRDYATAVTSQRCVRAGGKHNDLENVGYTARHHTFFEMLGNFSFGDYFKEEAIAYAWEFLTRELGIDPGKLWVSIYEDDDEAYALWEKVETLPKGRIVRMGEKDNFWAMGDTGPCGPCSEIHIDQGAAAGCGREDCALGCDCDRFLELWNLVFMQFNRASDGTMTRLPKPSIDTGMGLERVAAVLQGKFNNYDSDLFLPIIARLEALSGKNYGSSPQDDTAMRVIADHARATAFLVCDGVLPANEGRGYVLRRIMRRAVRYGKYLGLDQAFMEAVTAVVVTEMAAAYPHLADGAALLRKVVKNEEERFRETLEHGLHLLDEEIGGLSKGENITGAFIFKLYDTFGFPFDIVRDIALERGLGFDEPGFLKEMEGQRQKSRQARRGEAMTLQGEGVKSLIAEQVAVDFVGYDLMSSATTVIALLNSQGERVEELASGSSGQLCVAQTPCYAESGGQVGDSGEVIWNGGRARIETTAVAGEKIILQQIRVDEGTLRPGMAVNIQVDDERRRVIAAHHSATHLLHAALRQVLGDHVKQAGSLVNAERLRFDFTHFSPLTAAELTAVERLVNGKIRANALVKTSLLSREEALQSGAMALFGEKYADTVRVVQMADFTLELCGGTHVKATGEIGVCKIVSESGIAAGVRRIEALAGSAALADIESVYHREQQLCTLLGVGGVQELAGRIEALLRIHKSLEKQVAELSRQLAGKDLADIGESAVLVDNVRVVHAEIPLDSPKTLREAGDRVRDSLGSGVAVLGGVINGKAALLALVSDDLTGRIQAGALIARVAAVVGGKGGGRADMAQAGGPMADKLAEALRSVPAVIEELLRQDR
ncbi:MAG: alanine--tRNA ligase [Desulforhopalus sp.]|jgi:alanyl-tRNA synthetase|nr:alanine--tRNA ligase [Desulforhopalus sp.]